MRRFVIDTDTASDDAVAIMMAMAHADVHVEAITVVAGNVSMEQASINARFVVELMGAQVPVYPGCTSPWLRALEIADWFHGADGMGNQHYPPPNQPEQSMHAVEALLQLFEKHPKALTLVTLGPLTNIATALSIEPRLAQWVEHCYVMGGAANIEGNVTPAAEYNMWVDPEAAQKVMQSGMPITLLGWELSRGDSALSDEDINNLRSLNTRQATIAMDCNSQALKASRDIQGEPGLALADPCAMAVALNPSIAIEQSQHYVEVSLDSHLTRGMTVVDKLNVTGKPPNATVCYSIDAKQWKSLLIDALS
ncbi:MAG: nucleoside hydrolase [Gammaproteobacteria bacterium]|nr:nucleoside hydrolase [Gammaproteobacteria bacterium]